MYALTVICRGGNMRRDERYCTAGPRRAASGCDPRPLARRRAAGRASGRAARAQPTRRLQASAGASRGGARRVADRRPAPPLPGADRAAGRARRLARALPPALGAAPRQARRPPRSQEEEEMTNAEKNATLAGDRERPAVRLERDLPDPPEVVWGALTEREQLREWFPCEVIVRSEERRVGKEW